MFAEKVIWNYDETDDQDKKKTKIMAMTIVKIIFVTIIYVLIIIAGFC